MRTEPPLGWAFGPKPFGSAAPTTEHLAWYPCDAYNEYWANVKTLPLGWVEYPDAFANRHGIIGLGQ